MVMAGAGGVNHQELCDLTSKHFGKIGHTYDAEIPKDLNCRYTGNVMLRIYRCVLTKDIPDFNVIF